VPRALCERLRTTLLRDRTPPCRACPTAAYAAFRVIHSLHPPSRVSTHRVHGHPVLELNTVAWSPIDSAERSRAGGAAAAGVDVRGGVDALLRGGGGILRQQRSSYASTPGTGADWQQLSLLTTMVADATGGHGRPDITSAVAGKLLGARLLFMHTASVLADDVAARLAVHPAARAACGRDAARQIYMSASLWRLFDIAATEVSRSKFVQDLVAIIEAGAAPLEDAALRGLDVSSDEEEAADGAAPMATDPPPIGSPGPSSGLPHAGGSQDASQQEHHGASQPVGGTEHFMRSPRSGGKPSRPVPLSQVARQQEETAVATQLAAAEGFPTPMDVGHSAGQLLSALLDVLSCAEHDKCRGAVVPAAPAAAAAGGGGTRGSSSENLRAWMDEQLATGWLHSAKSRGSAAHGNLLAVIQGPIHALRLARVLVARTAHVTYQDAAALRTPPGPSPSADAGALLTYVAGRMSDVVRGQLCGGGQAATGRAVAKTALLLSHAVQAASMLDSNATGEQRALLAQQLSSAEAALCGYAASKGGLNAVASAALRVAHATVNAWVRQASA
jgi:hypothetical protein